MNKGFVMNSVITTATLEDTSTGAAQFVRLAISTNGSKTTIAIGPYDKRSKLSLTLSINTADIQRAAMADQLDDGR